MWDRGEPRIAPERVKNALNLTEHIPARLAQHRLVWREVETGELRERMREDLDLDSRKSRRTKV